MTPTECKHQLPALPVAVEMKPSLYTCLLCHVEQLEQNNARLRDENLNLHAVEVAQLVKERDERRTQIPLTKSGMTADECLALIERDREALRAENARLMGLVGEAMKEAERIRSIIATASDRSRDEAKAWANSEYGTQQAAAYRALIDVQNAIDAKPTDAAPPTDYRADAIASHLWLSQAGVPAAKTLVERVKGLVEQRDEARTCLMNLSGVCEQWRDPKHGPPTAEGAMESVLTYWIALIAEASGAKEGLDRG